MLLSITLTRQVQFYSKFCLLIPSFTNKRESTILFSNKNESCLAFLIECRLKSKIRFMIGMNSVLWADWPFCQHTTNSTTCCSRASPQLMYTSVKPRIYYTLIITLHYALPIPGVVRFSTLASINFNTCAPFCTGCICDYIRIGQIQ